MHKQFKPIFPIIAMLALLLAACEGDTPKQEEVAELPSPIREYNSVDEAIAAAGFHCPVPTELPRGYSQKSVETIAGGVIQIIYHTQGNLKTNYRVSRGNEDISGIYGTFTEQSIQIDGTAVLARMTGKRVLYATWQRDGLSFAVSFDDPPTEAVFTRFVASIPKLTEETGEAEIKAAPARNATSN